MNITTSFQYINDRIDTNDTDFPVAKKVRMGNVSQDKIVNAIIEQDRLYQYDDPNWNDLSEGFLNITDGTYKYDTREDENLANLLFIAKVFLMGKDGEYYELDKADEIEFNTTDSIPTKGQPTKYRITGKTLVLTPTPDYTNTTETVPQQAKMKIYFTRVPKPILVTDTVREIGIPTTFHHLWALDVCYQFASAKQMAVKTDLMNDILLEEKKLGISISKMNNNTNLTISAEPIDCV
jgi:hypothetical protein